MITMWIILSVLTTLNVVWCVMQYIRRKNYKGTDTWNKPDYIGCGMVLALLVLIGWGLIGDSIPVRRESYTQPYKLIKTRSAAYVIVEGQTSPFIFTNIKEYNTINSNNVVFTDCYNMYDKISLRQANIKQK